MLNRFITPIKIRSFSATITSSFTSSIVLVILVTLSSGGFAQDQKSSSVGTTTVSGEVLDLNCYMSHEAHGDQHKKCATECMNGGGPIGILTKEGKVYLVIKDEDKPEPYDALKKRAAETVTVTGEIYDRGGISSVEIESLK